MSIDTKTAALILAVLVSAACAGRRGGGANNAGASAGAAEAQKWDGSDAVEASLRGKIYRAAPELAAAGFGYDRSALDESALAVLKRNAFWLKANPSAEILIQGRCDERGTAAYNLALGQRRARAARDYYESLGVDARRMSTISYGEEKPLCPESTEECWARNRSAVTLLRADDVASAP